jgi:hypothetical protein
MPERITHHPSFKLCAFFLIRYMLYFVLVFFLAIPIINVSSAGQPKIDEVSSQLKSDPIYIIPDQTNSVLKFGVAISPDQSAPFRNNRFFAAYDHSFDKNYKIEQHADVSTVVRIALDEFKCFSGLNHLVHDMEKTLNVYSRKLMLTGELNLDSYKTDPLDYFEKINLGAEIFNTEKNRPDHHNKIKMILRQFEVNQLTWNVGFSLHSPELTFKLDIGKAFSVYSSVGQNVVVGAMIKLSI